MKKTLLQLACISISIFQYAQVGIMTDDPKSTLDVNGNASIRQVPEASSLSGYKVLILNQSSSEVSQISLSNLSLPTNISMYAAKKTTGISLLSLGLFPTGFRAVNFVTNERTIGDVVLFSDTDNTYITPSDGVYSIGYTFRYGTGVQASVLSNSPGIGILKNSGGVTTMLDSRVFSGVNVLVLSLTISEASINSIYRLKSGDKLSFGLTGSSLLSAGLLGSSAASFFIYKISD